MKIRKIQEIPAKTIEVITAVTCDLCGRKGRDGDWAKSLFDVEDVEISYESGYRYPECGSTEVISYDICPDCFKNKLMPWLKSQGADPEIKDVDW